MYCFPVTIATVTLPAGFSGDYDDLDNLPDIPDSAADINADLQAVTDVGNNTTNGITIDTDKIFLNADGSASFDGNVGIGTQSPTEKLDIRGNVYIGSNLQTDGSATFASYVKGEGNGSYFTVNRTGSLPDTAALYLGFKDGDEKFKVGIDGSL